MEEQENMTRMDSVMVGIESYAEMASVVSEGHPAKVLILAQWLSSLVGHLVEWEVISEQEQAEIMANLRSITSKRKEEMVENMVKSIFGDGAGNVRVVVVGEGDGDILANGI